MRVSTAPPGVATRRPAPPTIAAARRSSSRRAVTAAGPRPPAPPRPPAARPQRRRRPAGPPPTTSTSACACMVVPGGVGESASRPGPRSLAPEAVDQLTGRSRSSIGSGMAPRPARARRVLGPMRPRSPRAAAVDAAPILCTPLASSADASVSPGCPVKVRPSKVKRSGALRSMRAAGRAAVRRGHEITGSAVHAVDARNR